MAAIGRTSQSWQVRVEVLGKDSRFNLRDDPIVRVQARRLHVQLARYYREEGQDEELLIEMPKGGYPPTFHPIKSVAANAAATCARPRAT